MKKISDYITIREAAELIGVTPTTLRTWELKKKLIPIRNPISNFRLYTQEQIEEFLKNINPSKKEDNGN